MIENIEDKRLSRNKRQKNHSRYLRIMGAEREGMFNIEVGNLVFVQDAKNRNRFHLPGGDKVSKDWIYKQAVEQNWGTPIKRYIQKPTR